MVSSSVNEEAVERMPLASFLRRTFLFIACMLGLTATAQDVQSWQSVWEELMNIEDGEEEAGESTYELLQDLSEHPLDLNRATREELEQLPFLSEQQIMDLQAYLDQYGPMRSLGELRMIRSLDYQQIQLLPYFVYIDDTQPQDTVRFPRWKTIARYGKHELTAAARIPFYERKGDRNGYLGYRYRHALRYQFSYGDYVKIGLMGAQDAGEPFFSNGNKWGYDTYSYYVQVRKWGCLDHAIIGKYKLSAGMGLVLNNSFSLGKLAMLQNLGRTTRTIRPHASRSVADYFQGAATTVSLSKPLKLTLFASYRPLDATLNKDSQTVSTIVTSGYHRTPAEMQKKNNTYQTSLGGNIAFRRGGWHAGLSAVYTHLDRELRPNTETLYRRYYAEGSSFFNASIDYGYTHHRFSFAGETAMNADGAIATLNVLSYLPSANLKVVLLQRYYSMRYTTLHGHAFSEGGHVQNESGLFLGTVWQPLRGLQLSAYADVCYFPWARYRISQSSYAQDYLVEACYHRSHWTLKGRYRVHLRQLDNKKKTDLRRHNEHRAQLSLTYGKEDNWSATTQVNLARAANYEIENGWMLSEQLSWKHSWWQLYAMAAYFHTDSYDSRIYGYERQMPHDFYYPTYYGHGLRCSFVARADIGKHLQVLSKLGYTHYYDREKIGSGLQEIDAPQQTDMDILLRWRF